MACYDWLVDLYIYIYRQREREAMPPSTTNTFVVPGTDSFIPNTRTLLLPVPHLKSQMFQVAFNF